MPHSIQIVRVTTCHLRYFDDDVMITVGSQWEHTQENHNIGRKKTRGSEEHNAVAARHLFAMSEQSANTAAAVGALYWPRPTDQTNHKERHLT